FYALAEQRNRPLVPVEQRRKQICYKRLFDNFGKGSTRQKRNELRYQIRILRGLNHHGEFHGGLFHFHRSPGIGIKRSINDVGPVDQISDGLRMKTKTLLTYGGNETGTGFKIWIVKFAIALVLLEMGCIFGAQKCALVMVEPPGYFGRAGILEIHNRILITIEIAFGEESASPV